jgi:hypothetical protein
MTEPVTTILLEDMGFGLAGLAQAIGYPHAALRAFRSGTLIASDPITADDIWLKLNDIITMTNGLGMHAGGRPRGPEHAALFEARIIDGYSATGWDLYQYLDGARCARARRAPGSSRWHRGERVSPHHNGLCHLARGVAPEDVLDLYIADWRTRFQTNYRIVEAADGDLSIIPRDQP